jgi:hypothetical protein
VEEPSLLLAVQRVVRRIQIQNDFPGRLRVSLQEQFDQQAIHPVFVQHDLLVTAVGPLPRQLQPVQRALARQRLARIARPDTPAPRRVRLAYQRRQ